MMAAILACDPAQSGRAPSRDQVSPAARHAIESEDLRRIMHSLSTEVKRSWPQEIADVKTAQARRDREDRFKQAQALAAALAQSAESIPQATAQAKLSDAELKNFMDRVQQLKTEARELESAAASQDDQGMKQVLGRIQTTCNGCHERFSNLPGPIKFGAKGPMGS